METTAGEPPWKGTAFEPLLKRLRPNREPERSNPEAWYTLTHQQVRCIERIAPKPRSDVARYWQAAQMHERERKRAEEMMVTEPRYAVAKGRERFWADASASAQEALEAGRAFDRTMRNWVRDNNLPIAAPGNRQPDPETAAIRQTLAVVRTVTGKPHHATLAQLFTLAGRPTSAAWLKWVDPGRAARAKKK